MDTSFRPFLPQQLAELRGYAAWSTSLFRAAMFLLAVGVCAWLLRAVHDRLLPAGAQHVVWWIVPSAAFAIALYRVARRWTGGRAFRANVRADLSRGVAAVRPIVAIDAIEVEEQEDEGPAYFIRTDDGTTMLFAGQYLEACRRKGFPWKAFEILEAPASGIFLGIIPRGDSLIPSARRPPFTPEEFRRFRLGSRYYAIVDVPFEALRK